MEISTFIFIVLLVVLVVLTICDLAALSVYGKPISKKKAEQLAAEKACEALGVKI
jgi:dsRNA-specific ribonuclease